MATKEDLRPVAGKARAGPEKARKGRRRRLRGANFA